MSWIKTYFICKDCGEEFNNSDDIITENTFNCPKCNSKNTINDKVRNLEKINQINNKYKEYFKDRPKRI